MKRFWEIDAGRGLAVILMVLFNYSFALDYFHIYRITEGWFFWWLFPRLVAGTFILLAGLSITLSYSRNKKPSKHIRRGLKIFGFGIIITIVTWLGLPSGTILFGILHLIGLSIILGLLFIKLKPQHLAIIGLIIMAFGFYLNQFFFGFSWLLWLGLVPSGFYTLDYFPLLPWFGIFLIGMALGKNKYGNGKSKIKTQPRGSRFFCILGRHSLLIYLTHQLVLVVVLYALGLFL
ncbi:MAG TPA: DUF1624 domain-containing protein [Candidatus Aenigmarchaeota archaeon]|nr:DUF1624 domain-containing protein [Candidatus Aenigmarchaeota archaeon]